MIEISIFSLDSIPYLLRKPFYLNGQFEIVLCQFKHQSQIVSRIVFAAAQTSHAFLPDFALQFGQ